MSRAGALILAAVAAGVLYVVGALALGSPPEATDTPAQVLAWFRDHQDGARIYAWTAAFGTLAFAVVAAIVRGLLPKPHADVFLIGAAAFVVENAIQAWFWAALALHPATLQPETARTALDVAGFWGPLLTGTTMAMIGAVTALGLRRPSPIPGWLLVIGIVALLEQAIETVTVFGTHGFIVPGGAMNLLLGAGLTLLWLVGLVVWAAGRMRTEAAVA